MPIVYNSRVRKPTDGTTRVFTFSFTGGYIQRSHVLVQFTDALGATVDVPLMDSNWTGPFQLTFATPFPAGGELLIYRDTPKDKPIPDFADGSIINEKNLDKGFDQAIFAVAELWDRAADVDELVTQLITQAQTAEDTANLALDRATDAQLRAADAQQTAHDALAGAAGAEQAAILATAAAQAAEATANGIDAKADAAVATANGIDAKADAAVAIAHGARSKATYALATAGAAETKADAAVATANGIDAKADAAVAIAHGARSKATYALATAETKADAAVATANGIDAKADAAVAIAHGARSKATYALATAGAAMAEAADAKRAAAENVIPLGLVMWHPLRTSIPAGFVAADGQELSRATYPDFTQDLLAGRFPVATEADWQADPLKRGAYTLATSTTFRVPDLNGKSAGSIGRTFLSGDGKNAGAVGTIQRDADQRIQGTLGNILAGPGSPTNPGTGVVRKQAIDRVGYGGSSVSLEWFNFWIDNSYTARTADESRPTNVAGCYIIRVAGKANNPGNVDVGALAAEVATLSGTATRAEAASRALGVTFETRATALRLECRNYANAGQDAPVVGNAQRITFRPFLSTSNPVTLIPPALSLDPRQVGLNGRDQTDALPNAASVHIYAVTNGTNVYLSASIRHPNVGPNVAGMTHYCYLTTVLHNAASGLFECITEGNKVIMTTNVTVSNGVTSGNRIALSMAQALPVEFAATWGGTFMSTLTAGTANAALTLFAEWKYTRSHVSITAYSAANSSAYAYSKWEMPSSDNIWVYVALSGPSPNYLGRIFLDDYTVFNNSN